MSTILLITTYPRNGSKNIGDYLITESTKQMLLDISDKHDIDVVFRGAAYENIKHKISKADYIIFPGFAIRNHMATRIYPYLQKILNNDTPFSVLACGTALPVTHDGNIYESVDDHSIQSIREVCSRADIFTTRGALTQSFFNYHGMSKAKFGGDVAYYRTENEHTELKTSIEQIVISDPHNAKRYMRSFKTLLSEIETIFPLAKVIVALHGVNHAIESYCNNKSIQVNKIYENPAFGLDVYKKADMHVGYRVHGHVSALRNNKISYLLEQDGRGCDYGLTMNERITVANYRPLNAYSLTVRFVRRFITRRTTTEREASISPVFQLVSLIKHDRIENFHKFKAVHATVDNINKMLRNQGKGILDAISRQHNYGVKKSI